MNAPNEAAGQSAGEAAQCARHYNRQGLSIFIIDNLAT
jgi:hypothetical protein